MRRCRIATGSLPTGQKPRRTEPPANLKSRGSQLVRELGVAEDSSREGLANLTPTDVEDGDGGDERRIAPHVDHAERSSRNSWLVCRGRGPVERVMLDQGVAGGIEVSPGRPQPGAPKGLIGRVHEVAPDDHTGEAATEVESVDRLDIHFGVMDRLDDIVEREAQRGQSV